VATYVERDVRQLIAVRDLAQFQRLLKMCAARSGQMLNLAAPAADCCILAVTAREWPTVLEAGYLVMRLPPSHRNLASGWSRPPSCISWMSGSWPGCRGYATQRPS
jgi:predicted AAA+ superfamily ATPase